MKIILDDHVGGGVSVLGNIPFFTVTLANCRMVDDSGNGYVVVATEDAEITENRDARLFKLQPHLKALVKVGISSFALVAFNHASGVTYALVASKSVAQDPTE